MRRLLAAGLTLGTLTAQLSGQTRVIAGRVTDSLTAAGLPAVRLTVKNTTASASTKQDGTFTIVAPAEDVVLVTQLIGYQRREMRVRAEQATVEISMARDVFFDPGIATAPHLE